MILRTIILLLALLPAIPYWTLAETRVVTLEYRPPHDLLDDVRTVFPDPEQVQIAGPALLLDGSPERIATALELIALLDRPAAEVLIRLRWQSGSPNVRLSTDGTPNNREVRYLGNQRSRVEQSMRISEGSTGRMVIGRDIPYRQSWQSLVGESTGYAERISYQRVTTGFRIKLVKIAPQRVLLEVEPWLMDAGETSSSQAPYIDFQQFRTRIALPSGQWVELGRQFSDSNELGREVIRYGNRSSGSNSVLLIRADR